MEEVVLIDFNTASCCVIRPAKCLADVHGVHVRAREHRERFLNNCKSTICNFVNGVKIVSPSLSPASFNQS